MNCPSYRNLTASAPRAMLAYMSRQSTHHELNDWLKRNGYRHSQANSQETPHPYGISPRMGHARIDQQHPYVVSPRMDHARVIHQDPTGRSVFAAHERGHHITTAGRRALKRGQFALPPGPKEKRRGIKGRLPIDDIARARSALARASMMQHQGHITAKQLMAVRNAVHRAWPSIRAT
jgi:hypothetical protein